MKKNRIIIVGAGEAGQLLSAELLNNPRNEIVGFIDDDAAKFKLVLSGIGVLGGRGEINNIIQRELIDTVIVALPSAHKEIIRKTVDDILNNNPQIIVQVLPSTAKYFETPLFSELRDIPFSDIITRDELKIDISAINKFWENKTVMITGAGGSIGSEITKQLLRFKTKTIVCVGRGENSIYNLERSLIQQHDSRVKYHICDIRNSVILNEIMSKYEIDIVVHAAAHKHVPLMENNELEALHNNVYGTAALLRNCVKHNVERFILISTDKAVNPANVMGSTKRIAELVTGYYNKQFGLKTAVVRFGNVIGSRGSVIPLFLDQIKGGGPVTVTHPDVKRFFMSIPEASLLVINAASYSQGGDIYILNMGTQYKISEIAERLIRLSGLQPHNDIKIEFTGLRPGEKLEEELIYINEELRDTDNEKIFRIAEKADIDGDIMNFVGKIERFEFDNTDILRQETSDIIRKYNVISKL